MNIAKLKQLAPKGLRVGYMAFRQCGAEAIWIAPGVEFGAVSEMREGEVMSEADIALRLRSKEAGSTTADASLMDEAATEIERLKQRLTDIEQKDRIKTHEINVLVKENRELRQENISQQQPSAAGV